MSKCIARLAQAEYHPGVAVLRRVGDNATLWQMPMTKAAELLGMRKEAFYLVNVTNNPPSATLVEEIPWEEVANVQAELLGGESVPRVEGTPTDLEKP